MTTNCVKLNLFLQVEREIIEKHIETHKWFRQISDYNQGVADFIENYGWLMREMYCRHICPSREDCQISHEIGTNPIAEESASQAS